MKVSPSVVGPENMWVEEEAYMGHKPHMGHHGRCPTAELTDMIFLSWLESNEIKESVQVVFCM